MLRGACASEGGYCTSTHPHPRSLPKPGPVLPPPSPDDVIPLSGSSVSIGSNGSHSSPNPNRLQSHTLYISADETAHIFYLLLLFINFFLKTIAIVLIWQRPKFFDCLTFHFFVVSQYINHRFLWFSTPRCPQTSKKPLFKEMHELKK